MKITRFYLAYFLQIVTFVWGCFFTAINLLSSCLNLKPQTTDMQSFSKLSKNLIEPNSVVLVTNEHGSLIADADLVIFVDIFAKLIDIKKNLDGNILFMTGSWISKTVNIHS